MRQILIALFLSTYFFGCTNRDSSESRASESSAPAPAPAPYSSPEPVVIDSNKIKADKEAEILNSAIAQWKELRRNPDNNKRKPVTWTVKIQDANLGENLFGYLDDKNREYPVLFTIVTDGLDEEMLMTYKAARELESYGSSSEKKKYPNVADDDWVKVSGKFGAISNNGGYVIILIDKITNLGYKD